MKAIFRYLARKVFGSYRVNWVFANSAPSQMSLDPVYELREIDDVLCSQIASSNTRKLARSLMFARAGMDGFAVVRQGRPVCVAHFARPGQYDEWDVWPLRTGERALVDITTEQSARGLGIAPQLIAAMTRRYLEEGTCRLIAFAWWSNRPSIRMFAKAGWVKIGFSIDVMLAGKRRHVHIPLRQRGRARADVCVSGGTSRRPLKT
ncbi:MAG TPA: GNAT family N-acetyltransferase [Rhodanobacteraceae bacterium]